MTYDELIHLTKKTSPDVADAIERVCVLAGTNDSSWAVLFAAGSIIAELEHRLSSTFKAVDEHVRECKEMK